MSNLVNAERITMSYGVRILLEDVSLGLGRGDVVGVVGRNGSGKTTLLRILAETVTPDSGRITHTGHLSIGFLDQIDDPPRQCLGSRLHRWRRSRPCVGSQP